MAKPKPQEYDVKSNSTVELIPQDSLGVEITDPLALAWEEYKKENPNVGLLAFSNATTNRNSAMTGRYFCYLTNLDNLNFDDYHPYNCIEMFSFQERLTRVPYFDTSNVIVITEMFRGCKALKEIPAYDFSKVSNSSMGGSTIYHGIFDNCSSLERLHCFGMSFNFSIASSTKFTREALVEILNNLGRGYSTYKLQMGATNLAKLTADDIAIATAKGWTLL